MKNKRLYKLKKSRFLDWMFSDFDDIQYWGGYLLNEFKKKGRIDYTIEEMLAERDELPMWIMEGKDLDYMDEEMIEDMNEIELID